MSSIAHLSISWVLIDNCPSSGGCRRAVAVHQKSISAHCIASNHRGLLKFILLLSEELSKRSVPLDKGLRESLSREVMAGFWSNFSSSGWKDFSSQDTEGSSQLMASEYCIRDRFATQ